jgi:CRISPR-associated protein Cst1
MALLKWTGNPFVDAGIASILVLSKKETPEKVEMEDLHSIVPYILDLYLTDEWCKSLTIIFTSNVDVVNCKYPLADRSTKYKDFLLSMLEDAQPLSKGGNCICCGARNAVVPVDRRRLPLAGKVKSNYLSGLAEGVDLCNLCTFAVQYSPLFMYKSGDKLLLLHSNNLKVMKYWGKRSVSNSQEQVLKNKFTGCFDEGYNNTPNSIFHIISDLILTYNEVWKDENVFIKMTHFTNFTKLPEIPKTPIVFYELPAPIFNFLAEVKTSSYKQEWDNVIKHAYIIKKPDNTKKKNNAADTKVDFTNMQNRVYNKLLKYENITANFFSKKDFKTFGSWNLLKIYLQEVLFMSDKKIEYLKDFADRISEIIKLHPNGKKRINDFLKVQSYQELRNVFLRLIRDNISLIQEGKELNKEPLVKIDEYLEYLFPFGGYWRETFDILLFRIYENLNDWFISEKIIEENISAESEENNNNQNMGEENE